MKQWWSHVPRLHWLDCRYCGGNDHFHSTGRKLEVTRKRIGCPAKAKHPEEMSLEMARHLVVNLTAAKYLQANPGMAKHPGEVNPAMAEHWGEVNLATAEH